MSNYLRIRNDAKPSLGYICVAACYYFKCYQVQAHFSHHTIGQQIQEMSCWGKEYDFIQRADWQRRWQTKVSKSLSCWGPWCQVFLWIRDGERQGNNVKSPFNSCRYLWDSCRYLFEMVILFPMNIYAKVELLDRGSSSFKFLRILHTVHVAALIFILIKSIQVYPFLHILTNPGHLLSFWWKPLY